MNSADDNMFTFNGYNSKKQKAFVHKIVYHGTIAKRFGLHYFINALPHVIKAIPEVEFHLYGTLNDNYAYELKELIQNLNLNNNVIFKDPIPYSEVNSMIKTYDLGVVTYELTEYMNLALPTKACEYASSGLPFIISNLISVKTIFRKESVLYVNPQDSGYDISFSIEFL